MEISDRWRKLLWITGAAMAAGLVAFIVVYLTTFQGGKDFIDDFFNWTTFKQTIGYIFGGLRITIELAVVSEICILILGLIVSLIRISRVKIFRTLAGVYIDVIRGMPLLLQILIIYYGLAYLGLKMSAFVAGIIALTVCYAAYEAEIFRAGIESIHRGQMEAARSLGMGYFKSMRYVILPQAVRNVIPPLSNEFIALLKDTALLSVIGVSDILRRATEMVGKKYNVTPLMGAALCYLIITIPLIRLVQYMTKKLAIKD